MVGLWQAFPTSLTPKPCRSKWAIFDRAMEDGMPWRRLGVLWWPVAGYQGQMMTFMTWYLVGGDWNHGILTFQKQLGMEKSSQLTSCLHIFQRGKSTTNQWLGRMGFFHHDHPNSGMISIRVSSWRFLQSQPATRIEQNLYGKSLQNTNTYEIIWVILPDCGC